MTVVKAALLSGALALGAASFTGQPAAALPLSPAAGGQALASQYDQLSPLVEVRRRRGGAGLAAGIVGGMILGGIVASQARPYYYYDYPPPRRVYRAYPYYDPAIEYCMRRFRSYDPYSQTYLGFDGLRHPCP